MLKQFGHEPFLRQVSRQALGHDCPLKVDTEEPEDGTHEIDLDMFSQSGLEPLLDVLIGGTAHKIVQVAAHIDGDGGKVRMDANEDARAMHALLETHAQWVTTKVVLPSVARRATQPIEGLAKFPATSARRRDWTSGGGVTMTSSFLLGRVN